jgi:hypothetical protein
MDLLEDLRSFIDVVPPNGNPLYQKVTHETLPKFCKNCKVLGHSTEACSKNQVDLRLVEKKGTSKEAAMSKGSVFSILSPSVDAPTEP